jgi:lactoylglutathione lyase
MKLEHTALWVTDLEKSRDFYTRFFGGQANAKYVNPQTGFESYFITFDSGARLELMRKPAIPQDTRDIEQQRTGYIHVAFSAGSRLAVNELTENLRASGYRVVGEPRQTGDGYYESCVLDPEGNRVEIAA